jgi:parallel beta-helix repeat protein
MFHGIHINGAPSTDIRVSDVTFSNNGGVDVRTDTSDPSQYHGRVLVTNNVMSGSSYGVALSNCGDAPASACEVRDNTVSHVAVSGVDLNRSRYTAVSGNRVSDCLNGLGVDDSQFATISNNTVQACRGDGIQMANGAVPANRPWSVSNNQVFNNTLLNNAGFGLASYGTKSDAGDRNESNTWTNNQISGNAKGGCDTNAAGNTFVGNAPQGCAPQR